MFANVFFRLGPKAAKLFLKAVSGPGISSKALQMTRTQLIKSTGYGNTKLTQMAKDVVYRIPSYKNAIQLGGQRFPGGVHLRNRYLNPIKMDPQRAQKHLNNVMTKDWGKPSFQQSVAPRNFIDKLKGQSQPIRRDFKLNKRDQSRLDKLLQKMEMIK